MFNFFKTKKSDTLVETEKFTPFTDIHSHILPGIDDGSPDIETSLSLVRGLKELGIERTVATPHIIGDLYRNTPESINDALIKLQNACKEQNIEIEISAAAEYMLDDYFIDLLKNKTPLLTVHDNIVLTEQSYMAPTSNLNEISFELITDGYKPIMAHPERYFYYHNSHDEYFHLKDMGFLLQVNLLSLTGYYGKAVRVAAKFLFENNLVDLIGTDMHHTRHLDALKNNDNIKLFNKFIAGKKYNILAD